MIVRNINSITLAGILTNLFKQDDETIVVSVDNSNRLQFKDSEKDEFLISSASYNMKQITGLYNTTFPVRVHENSVYTVPSVGFYLSTPVLYLISNLGARCFQSRARNLSDQKVVMRINNSFMSYYPLFLIMLSLLLMWFLIPYPI